MPRILIADDSPLARHLLRRAVESAIPDAELFMASDGAEASTLLATHAPDIAILEVSMPAAAGISVCRAIRANPRFATMGLVIITAQVSTEAARLARDAGADRFLTKPVSPPALIAAARDLVPSAS